MPNDFAAVILAGRDYTDTSCISGALRAVAADSGAEWARKSGIQLSAIVGDFDSVSQETLDFYKQQDPSCEIVLAAEQEHNDFEKILHYLAERWHGEVRIIGLTGGRIDHTISNLSVMLRFTHRFKGLTAFDPFGSHFFLTSGRTYSFENRIGTIISLMPFGDAEGIVTRNFRYPLSGESLSLGQREGLSNVVIGSPASISIERGALIISVMDQ